MLSDATSGFSLSVGCSRSSIDMVGAPPVVKLITTSLSALILRANWRKSSGSCVGRPSFGSRACRCTIAAPAFAAPMAASAISSGVIGRCGDMVGVWIEPVTAHVMMTLPCAAAIVGCYPGGTMKLGILGVLLAVALPAAAERAASIDYEFVPRPSAVPAEYDGAGLRFLAIQAIDGARVEAALWQPTNARTLVLMVHGSGETYHGNPNGFLGKGLAERGYAVLAINTRQSGPRVNTDNFMDVRRDIEAAFYTARALGHKAIVLHGHSLGNVQVQYFAANMWQSEIKAVVLTGMFGNLPWKSRHILVQNEGNWSQLFETALKNLRQGKASDVLPVQMNWITGQKVPMSAQHFLTYRWENTSAADGTYWIRRIPHPILMVRDDGDAIIQPFEPYMLLSAAGSSGSLVPSIEYVKLPNKERGPAEHGFINNRQPLTETVAGWPKEQNLGTPR